MGIALACLPSVVITLVLGGLRATEYVVVIVAGSSEPSIRVERIIEERMEEWPPHDDHPLTHNSVLRLGCRACQQGHRAREQQCGCKLMILFELMLGGL